MSTQIDIPPGAQTAIGCTKERGHQQSKWLWLHAAYHTTIITVGTGILGLPYSFSQLGFIGGTVLYVIATVGSYYTALLLIDIQGTKQVSYSQLADSIMGNGFSRWGVRPFQILQIFSASIILVLVAGVTMASLDVVLDGHQTLSTTLWIVVAGSIAFLLSLAPDLESAWPISMVGTMSAICIPVICVVGSAIALTSSENVKAPTTNPHDEVAKNAFKVMSAFGIVFFAYGFHAVLPDVQSSLTFASVDESRTAMRKAVGTAMSWAGVSYLLVPVLGYAAFGSEVETNVLINITPFFSKIGNVVVSIIVIVKVSTEGAVFNQTAFKILEETCSSTKEGESDDVEKATEINKKRKIIISRAVVRTLYVAVCTFLAVALPFFGDLEGFAGAIGITALSFVVPFILWNHSEQAKGAPSWRVALHRALAVAFAIIGFAGALGSMYDIIQNVSTYVFFQN